MSAYGSLGYNDLPSYAIGAGLRSDYATLVSPGGRVYYVRSPTVANGDTDDIAGRLIPTLAGAMSQCRPNAGDTILILPGHTESVAAGNGLLNLVAGVNIVGLGTGPSRPTFTWAAQTSNWTINQPNVSIKNCVLNLDPGAGTVTVTTPIMVLAAGVSIIGCRIRMGTTATSKVGIGIGVGPAAPDFLFAGNDVYGETAAECTCMLQFIAAKFSRLYGNSIVGATNAAGNGIVMFTSQGSTFIKWDNNTLRNNKASSTVVVTGIAANSGEVDRLFMGALSDAGLTSFWNGVGGIQFGPDVSVANTTGERAAPFGTASA